MPPGDSPGEVLTSAVAMATLPLMQMEPTMTRQEVADVFKVSLKTLQRWEKSGLLVPLRVGVNVRYRREDVQAVIDRQAASA